MTQKAAALYDAGAPAGEPSNMAKYAAAEAAIHCVDQAIQTHGGNGFALEYGLTDMYWGVRLVRTAPVSREMILNYVAEHSLGLPRSYELARALVRPKRRVGVPARWRHSLPARPACSSP